MAVIVATVTGGLAPRARANTGADDDAREHSLDEMLDWAMTHAPASTLAALRQGEADAERAASSPLLAANPTVELGIGPRFVGLEAADFDFVGVLSQPVELPGARALRLDAVAHREKRLQAETTAARLWLRREVTVAYADAVVAGARLRQAERAVAFADELAAIARRRLQAGDVAGVDVRVADVDLARAREARAETQRREAAARLHLAEVAGWPLEALPRVVPTLPPPAPVPALAVVLDGAARGHAALVARRAAVDEAARRVAVAEREAWPVPAFGVQVAREGSAGSPANTVVLGTLGVPLPLWQQNQGETAHRRVDEAVARAEAAAAERANRVAVLAAHTALVAAAERVALWTDGIVAPLDENLAVLQRGFAAGEFALVDVTVARERFLAAERDALDAIVDYHVARADLEYAVGAPLPAAASPGVDVPAPAGVRR